MAVRILNLAPRLIKHSLFLGKDPYLPFKPIPNTVHKFRSGSDEFDYEITYNSMGFRDVEHSFNKPDNTFRILGIGDSFTLGFGAKFEESYLFRLEKKLNAISDNKKNVEIIKAGIGRYYPELERIFLEHYGVKYEPDLIIVGFVPNDINDTFMGMETITVQADGYLLTREANEIGRIGSLLYINSHLMRLILDKYIKSKIDSKYEFEWGEIYKPNDLYELQWKQIENEFEKIVSIADSINSQVLFLHIPHMNPFFQDKDWDLSYPGKRLSAWSEQKDINFVDSYPILYKESQNKTLYWPIDGHCNSEGYKIISDILFEYIIENKFIE